MPDQLMARLRSANPAPPHIPTEQLSDDQLRERILAIDPAWETVPSTSSARTSRRRVQGRLASGIALAAALAVVLVISLTGRAPNIAHAFPILNGPSTITPSELSRSVLYYGVGPGNDGIDLNHGHAVSTQWGTGYVLTNQQESAICVVAPGLTADGWGAACATRSRATTTGIFYGYAYDAALHSARVIGLFPKDAIITTTAHGGLPHRLPLHHGVLAVNISRPERLTITVDHRTFISQIAPEDAHPVYGSSSGPSTVTSTTATGMTSTTSP
ncbi:MAG TPA: hypothetical protein VIX82_19065 [Solirubrobacteraceae bacterium]